MYHIRGSNSKGPELRMLTDGTTEPMKYDAPMSNLFQAAGLEREAPRPLADRLRPKKLAEVVGQDHLVGAEGTLTRMLEAGACRA